MISPVNPYPPDVSIRSIGNASMDYLNLALVVETSKNLRASIHEFIYTYDAKKMYISVQGINNKKPGSFISTII